MKCPGCKKETLRHRHNEAHGISGTHMAGSERYECECGFYAGAEEEGKKHNLEFFIDKEKT